MQAIVETVFDAVYLVSVITIGILMIRGCKGSHQFKLFGLMAVVLGAGDSFHLIPRALALCTTGLENFTVPLGLGKWITSVTMTVFYVLLYYVWRERYRVKGGVYAGFCKRFELPAKKKYNEYSTGMKMKLCLAVALSHHPKLLLLDEATSGLDPVVRDELIDLLLDFVRDEDHAILISSHIVSDLEKLCDTIAFLHKGRLLLCEDKDTLREEYALWHGTAAQLEELAPDVVVSQRVTPYGAEALVKRDGVPTGSALTPVSIEELFVLMVKGEKNA